MITMRYLYLSADLWGAFFCLIAIISIAIGKSFDRKGSRLLIGVMICSMFLMLTNASVWLFRGREGLLAWHIVRISAFLTFFFGFLAIPLMAEYLTYLIVSRSDIAGLMWKYVEWAVFLVGTALIVVNLFNGFIYSFDQTDMIAARSPGFMIPGIIGIFGLLISIGIILEYLNFFNHFEQAAFISYLLLPVAGIGLDIYFSQISYTVLALVISSLLLYFSYNVNSREYRLELEKSLADQQIRMFNHQIQPHFLFNSLSVIKYQSRNFPEEALDTIDEFSDYLRACSDMMSSAGCVSAERELQLVQHYINLQKKRFGDQIDYRPDLQDTDFELPPFTIQTCVENAFTHGLRPHPSNDAYISVRTWSSPSNHIIEIEDNGAGFNVKDLENNTNETHVGIRNTRDRLRLMCGGSLHIDSAPGKGTRVIITIPVNRKRT